MTPLILSLLLAIGTGACSAQERPAAADAWETPVQATIDRLLAGQDTDRDKKITVDDRGSRRFDLQDSSGSIHPVEGTYALSLLLQELSWAREAGQGRVRISSAALSANPVDRTSRLIREVYWDSLTRTIDRDGIERIVQDDKTVSTDRRHVYVPHSDARAFDYFRDIQRSHPEYRIMVERLPHQVTPRFVRSLDGRHGILTLALTDGPMPRGVPFVVPGGRFNEMYGWDSYFITLGLLSDGRVDLAKAMVDNHIYQIRHYGKILNANRSYYLTRSQPPFLSSMLRETYASLPKDAASRAWLRAGLSAVMQEYETVWTAAPRAVAPYGLSRYHDDGTGPCPEVEPGHYDAILTPYARARGVSPADVLHGLLAGKHPEPRLAEFFVHDRAVRESGHDTTYRFDNRTADFLTVDLNSLLYKTEADIAAVLEEEFGLKDQAAVWRERARLRRKRINALLWDEGRGLFFDYDIRNNSRSGYVSATTFYPLWAGIATDVQARSVAKNALPELELLGGLAASSRHSRGELSQTRPERQWDYPNGWAPHQILAWRGLANYGLHQEAQRLTYRWLWAIAKNARDYNGTVPEKLDVEKASHKVFAEYGNVGTKFSYITKEGFGWMNASFQLGLKSLPPELSDRLRALTPPDSLFQRAAPGIPASGSSSL
ncbi:MAG: trehalase family glycosidase [Elusimicrobia bacterium]|nr:trehalase family glycosidase [Elusimicrobiota bacterium]